MRYGRRYSPSFVWSVLFLLLLVGGCVHTPTLQDEKTTESTVEEISIVDEVLSKIEKYYFHKNVDLDYCREIVVAWDTGAKLPPAKKDSFCFDKYSMLHTPREALVHKVRAYSGEIYRLGVTVKKSETEDVVVSSVARGILFPGDIIRKVVELSEGKETAITISKRAPTFLFGKEGTFVIVSVERGGQDINLPPIKRDLFIAPLISYKEFPEGIGYINIRGINRKTRGIFLEALSFRNLGDSPRVIIDVRDNPGGHLQSTLDMLSLFASKENEIILQVRLPKKTILHLAKSEGISELQNYRIVVLVNKRSMSAAELFAGVMQDWARYNSERKFTIIGENSYGKGIVQTTMPLRDGSAVTLTTGEYFVGPSGIQIQDVGVQPDVKISDTRKSRYDTATSKDWQFLVACRYLDGCEGWKWTASGDTNL